MSEARGQMVASLRLMPGGCSRAAQIARASSEPGSPIGQSETRIAAGSARLEPSSQLGASASVAGEATPSEQEAQGVHASRRQCEYS